MKNEFKEYLESFDKKVCGYANYDTFLSIVDIDNIKNIYDYVKDNKDYLLELEDSKLIETLKELKFIDKINWKNVNLSELREHIKGEEE